jgi:hypothetical protein
MNERKVYNLAKRQKAIYGRFGKSDELQLRWLPYYIEDFPKAVKDINLEWEKCKFVKACTSQIPKSHGVYCFSTTLGQPFPEPLHVPLYIGKAAPGYLSERFESYFREREDPNGRTEVVMMLNRYKNKLFFWWSKLRRVDVDIIEEHLLMCCQPPCNTKIPKRDRLWSKAFEL